jgi:cAMP phosphodiesterase
MPGRLLTSFMINGRILMDAGSAAQVLDLEEQARITDIFISHPHLDHIADIAFIADNLLHFYIEEERAPIRVHALELAVENIKQHLLNGAIWPDFTMLPHPHSPVLTLDVLGPVQSYDVNGVSITPFLVNHAGEGATGYIFRHNGKVVAYTGDTGPEKWPEALTEMGEDVTDLIVEVSFPNEMKNIALLTGHLTPELLRACVDKLAVAPNIYVTHVKSVGADHIEKQLHQLFQKESVRILKEGDVLDL